LPNEVQKAKDEWFVKMYDGFQKELHRKAMTVDDFTKAVDQLKENERPWEPLIRTREDFHFLSDEEWDELLAYVEGLDSDGPKD